MTTAVDPMGSLVLVGAADAFLRAGVVAAIAAAVLFAWRGAPLRARTWTWSLVLYAAVAMPLVVRALPLARLDLPVTVGAAVNGLPEALMRPVDRISRTSALVFRANPALDGPPRVSWTTVGLVVYAAGAFWMLTQVLRGWIAARRLGAHGIVVDDLWLRTRIATHAARLAGLDAPRVPRVRRVPQVIEQARLLVPVTMHLRRPVIALPADWRDWSRDTLDAVLLHELSHIVRGDTRTLWLSRMYRACAWVNPLSWWLHARLADLAEQASDEAALEAGIDRASYAELLLSFVARLPGTAHVPAAAVAMARPGRRTERRIDRVLAWKRSAGGSVMTHTRGMQIAIGIGLLAVVGGVASVRVTARDLPTRTMFAPLGVGAVAAPSGGSSPVALAAPLPRQQTAVQPAAASGLDWRSPLALPQGPLSQVIESGFGAGAYHPGADVTNPILVKNVMPKYTTAALARKVSGEVELEIVVLTDGTVGEMRITKSLDTETGLDDQAARAARQWLFKPATRNGQPVNVVVRLVMDFHLARSNDAESAASGSYVPQPLADAFAQGAYWSGETGVTLPKVVQQVDAKYTSDAMREKIQGVVGVELIVMADGSVGNARVVRSLDTTYGLDDSALAAARQWQFAPGTLGGRAVPVLVTIEVYFRLH